MNTERIRLFCKKSDFPSEAVQQSWYRTENQDLFYKYYTKDEAVEAWATHDPIDSYPFRVLFSYPTGPKRGMEMVLFIGKISSFLHDLLTTPEQKRRTLLLNHR